MDKERLKKVTAAGTGSIGIVSLFFALHGDIKAEIKSAMSSIGATEDRVIKLETQEIERDRRFITSMERIERKLDKIEEKIDRMVR